MNETAAAAILGVVQGLTEFLPVSSSGHLVLFQSRLPVLGDPVAFDLVLHLGTLLPVLWIYRADLASMVHDAFQGEGPPSQRPGLRLLALMVLGSVPTAIIGLSLEDVFEHLFSTPVAVGVALLVTGALLFATRYAPKGTRGVRDMDWRHALAIGTIQGMAITPGISRSGSTIALALYMGIERETAARYSFLLSVPAIGGAFLLKLRDLDLSGAAGAPLLVGFTCAAVSGYVALRLLLRLVKTGDFSRFCWYVWPLGLAAIAWGLWGAGSTAVP